MNLTWEDLKNQLKKKRIKVTRQREQLLRLFLAPERHLMTAAQVHLNLQSSDHQMDPSTVYRNLETLAEAGIIRHISLNDGLSRYELVTDHHHHHLVCLQCKEMQVVDVCPFEEINRFVKQHTDFLPTEHHFEIYGYCSECRRAGKKEKNDYHGN